MRRTLLVCLAALAVLLGSVAPARAVTDGYPDSTNVYDMVGLVVFSDASGPTGRCTGTLLSPTLFLTAGHCTDGAVGARVYFGPEIFRAGGYPFTGGVPALSIVTMSAYAEGGFPNTGDLGLVTLATPVRASAYATIAGLGSLDALATERGRQDTTFTVVGYGLQGVKPVEIHDLVRTVGTVRLVNLRSSLTDGFNLHHTNARGTGGGTCFGDSGGPVFVAGTLTIAAVTSFGLNANCAGAGFAYRVDTAEAQGFIYGG